ncbi:MAG: LLM class flavin-dependent oxidoreductase [Thermoleophilaceae bacterium]
MSNVAFGVGLPLEKPLDELLGVARQAEELGYDYFWANDDRLQKDVFTVLAASALATERIRLGPGVTNPYSRHPALIAAAVATLDELSRGRAALGLGAGGTNHRALAVTREAPVATLREAVELIRSLWAGSEVTFEGRVVRAVEAKLDFSPVREAVPIYIGARGPRMLELAGEIADGVIVGNVATVEGWSYALGRVTAGAERVGRDPASVAGTAWIYSCIADDENEALDAVRPMVATSLVTSRPILDDLGIEMPERFARVMESLDWSLSHEATERAGETIPDDIVLRFALAGAPAGCQKRLRDLLAAFPQISQVVIVPFAGPGQRIADVVRRFMDEVARDAVPRATASGV